MKPAQTQQKKPHICWMQPYLHAVAIGKRARPMREGTLICSTHFIFINTKWKEMKKVEVKRYRDFRRVVARKDG